MTTPWSRRLTASFLSALAAAAAAYAATLFALYLISSLSIAAIATYSGTFLLPGVVLLVVLFIAGLIDAFASWWGALVAGAVGGALGAAVGGLSVAKGQILSILGTVVGFYLAFMVLSALAAIFIGPRVWRAVIGRPASRGRVAFVRVPAANLSDALTERADAAPIDLQLADRQWDDYVAALSGAGWQTVEIAPADRLADGVFVEDAAIILSPNVGVITRPGAPSRRAETSSVADRLREQGLTLYEIEEPGTIDGGDVLIVGSTVYVGRSGRTDADGIRQLREVVALAGLDLTVVAVPVRGALHLKTVATALPDGTVLVHGDGVDASVFARSVRVQEPAGANVVVLDESTVLVSTAAPQTAALIADLGYRVVPVEVSEFEKLDGSVSCLSIRL